jgi:Sulfatase-modifying factor enzyme 1
MKQSIILLVVLGNLALLSHNVNAQTIVNFSSGVNQFSLNFVPIGNPGNANDTTGYGGVSYNYNMGVYDVSQTQLTDVATVTGYNLGGGAWSGNQPAANVDWYQAAAFVNYLNTSQGYAPAYNLKFAGNTPDGINLWTGANVWTLGGTDYFRNANAKYFLPSENEWYKAAYYSPTGVYYKYATGGNTAPTAVASGTAPGTAVFSQPLGQGPAAVNQAGGLSRYGTMGQSGNVNQWTETDYMDTTNSSDSGRVFRGGWWALTPGNGSSASRSDDQPGDTSMAFGFRVASFDGASVPEPRAYLLLGAGILVIALLRQKTFKL